jgi:hypothetical protein
MSDDPVDDVVPTSGLAPLDDVIATPDDVIAP